MHGKLLYLTLAITCLDAVLVGASGEQDVAHEDSPLAQDNTFHILQEGISPMLLLPSIPLLQESLPQEQRRLKEEVEDEKEVAAPGITWDDILAIWDTIKSFYLPQKKYIDNDECVKDVSDRSFILKYNKLWMLQMIDSWGKLPDGFLFGNVRASGMFEECIKVEVHYNYTYGLFFQKHELRNYTGRYCNIYYQPNLSFNKTKSVSHAFVGSGLAFVELASPLPFSYATCMPSTCTSEDLMESLNGTMQEHGIQVVNVRCFTDDDPPDSLIPEDKAMLSILGVFGALVVLATIYDIITVHLGLKQWREFLCFSLYRNMKRVFTYDVPEGADIITCLPALRVVTMSWIIICHQYETNYNFIVNTLDSLKYQDPVIAQVVTNGWLSVDTFLFMTGLVLTYRLLPHIVSRRPVSHLSLFLKTLFRRFFRLAPTILCVALFCASLLRFLGNGPRSHFLRSFQEDCSDHWWKDPLFINNYVFPDNEGNNVNDCLDNCWYTAVDMQLLLILPILLLPLSYFGLKGLAMLVLATVLSILVPLFIIIGYDLPPIPLHYLRPSVSFEYMKKVYLVPWCRAGPWLVGVWTALLLRHPLINKVKIPRLVVFLGYIAAISLGLGLVLGLFPFNHVFPSKTWVDQPAMSAAYGALARPAWGLCLGWVVFTAHTGNAKLVNHILSYPGWRPLARLTFTMYLVAPVVQLWWSSVLFVPTHFDYLAKLFESLGVTFIAGVVGLLLTCFIELPISCIFDLHLPSAANEKEGKEELQGLMASSGSTEDNVYNIPIYQLPRVKSLRDP